MFFYTGKGDKGCSVIGKKKYPKDSLILDTLGDVDELNSVVGLVKAGCRQADLSKKLQNVQEALFIIQARIAWFLYPKFKAKELSKERIEILEKEIETAEKTIRPERGFVLAGANEVSSWLDVLRAISRRVERRVFALSKKKKIPREIVVYLNRLSSYFYALARLEAFTKKIKEPKPTYK